MTFSHIFKSALAAGIAVLALASAPLQALVLTVGGATETFGWSFNTGTGAGTLTGDGFISASIAGPNLQLDITLNNTSALAANRLTSFGFGIDPNATGVTLLDADDGGLVDATMNTGGNTNIPSLVGIEVCAFGGNDCAGGSNGGIAGGASDIFALILGGSWGSTVNVLPIGFKYQTDFDSFEFTNGGGCTANCTPVPEPATMALLGIGLLGLCVGLRLRRA